MPLQVISSDTAQKNLRSGCAIWPARKKNNRKGVVPLPRLRPTFQIQKEDSIFCLGSCFAVNIAYSLSGFGFNVVVNKANPFFTGDWGRANHLIRYNILSILNEFRWAMDPEHWPFRDDFFLDEEGDLFMDAHGHSHMHPHPKDLLVKLREFAFSITNRLPECRIVVLTLGLVEVWKDSKTGLYLNLQPGNHALHKEPNRFSLHVLDYHEIFHALEEIYALLQKSGHPDFRILITTSPVPLHATFTDQDIFVANMYSKSVQRAALGEFVAKHSNVDYFPSYESIMLGNPDLIWEDDQRHVTPFAIEANMEHVMSGYTSHREKPAECMEALKQLDNEINSIDEPTTWGKILELSKALNQERAAAEELRAENRCLKEQMGIPT